MTAPSVVASVVVCTRDRAAQLGAMLRALAATEIPADLACEVVVVDNGSTDATRDVVAGWDAGAFAARYLVEPAPGVARARNVGLGTARGRIILFLDDDVRPPAHWLEPMCRPILAGAADAVAGGVRLAAHLERPWMQPRHRTWLADTSYLDRAAPQEMVSANMAIGRHVLSAVPGFDVELGPGALGYGEDALFSQQLLHAGFRITSAFDAAVEHHVDPHRLSRAGFREAAEQRGRTLAYRRHHWEHIDLPDAERRLRRRLLRLLLTRLARPVTAREGMPEPEMLLREDVAFLRRYRRERRKPRNYDRHGLVKRAGVLG